MQKVLNGEDSLTSTDWGRVFLVYGAGVMAAFHVGKVPPVLPMLRTDLGMSLVLSGWVLSAISLIGAFISSSAGAISDSFGHRSMMLFGLTCMAMGSLIGSFAQTSTMILGTRFIEGLGYIWIIVSAPPLLLKITMPNDERFSFGIWGSFMPAGIALMMLIAPFLVNSFGWQGLWRVNAVVPCAFAVCLALATRALDVRPSGNRNPVRNLGEDVWLTVKTPGPLLYALCFGAYAFEFTAVTGFLPTFLIEDQGMTQVHAAVLSALVVAMNASGNVFGGWLLQKGIKRWCLVAVSNLIMGLCCFGIYESVIPFSLRYLLCLAFSGGGGVFPVAALHGVTVNAPTRELVATSQGILLQGAQVGSLTGPPVVAAVVSRAGHWKSAVWAVSAIALLGVILSFVLRSIERRRGIE